MATTTTTTTTTVMQRMRRLVGYWRHALRLATFATVVLAVLLGLAARAAARQAREQALALGRQMMDYGAAAGAPSGAMGAPRALELNGAQLELRVGVTGDAVGRVLDVYAQRCAARGVLRAGAARGALTPLRHEAAGRGFVACFDLGAGVGSLLQRLERFGASGDLAAVGGLRYVYAERADTGRTRFVTLHADGPVNLAQMFPREGDAPGSDALPEVPRAAGLRRVLAAREQGAGGEVAVYTGRASAGEVARHYRGALAARGFREVAPGPASSSPAQPARARRGGTTALTFRRGDTVATFVIAPGAGDTLTVTRLVAL